MSAENRQSAADALTIAAVGDISLGDHPVCVGHGMRDAFARHGAGVLAAATPAFSQADIALANVETVASEVGLDPKNLESREMRGSPKVVDDLYAAGLRYAAVANNHAMQHGPEAFADTVRRLEQASIEVVGLDGDDGRSRPAIITRGGKSHVLVGVSFRPEEWHQGPVPYAQREDVAAFLDELSDLRARHDGFLIVSVHWGLEFLDYPGPDQIKAGHALVDAGADLVLGHHSHLLQPIERYRHGLIFYSLGNFAFDLWDPQTKLSGVARIELREGHEPSYSLEPMVIGNGFRVRPADPREAALIEARTTFKPGQIDTILAMTDAEYTAAYHRARRAARPKKYAYFARNITRYPAGIILQSLSRTLIRRLTGQ